MTFKALARRVCKRLLIAFILGYAGAAAALAAPPVPHASADGLPNVSAPVLSPRAKAMVEEKLTPQTVYQAPPDGSAWRPPGFHGSHAAREPVGSFWYSPDRP